ncbi:right-handed parallel beta-helix repeat-containing protein [Acinetobacter baumannii]
MNYKHLSAALLLSIISVSASANFIENTDITEYVNSLIEQNKTVTIPAGNYLVSATKSIQLKDNSTLKLSPNTVLNVIPTSSGSYRVFKIRNVKNVNISGGKIIGDKYTHLGKTGEWGMGVEIRDSQNISISNMSIDKMWGDAIYIGTDGKNSTYNIKLSNIEMDDNRRQGLTIISVDTLHARNLRATNTNGAKPSGGIDIEPNNGTGIVKNIILEDIVTLNNAGPGIQIGLSRYTNSTTPVAIKISKHTDKDSQYGLLLGAINAKSFGGIQLSSINYSKSKGASCFNSWDNKRFNVDISGELGSAKNKSCQGHLRNPKIKVNSSK